MRKYICTVGALLTAGAAFAVDTAFWKPYKQDKDLFFFADFNNGNVVGKFGKGLKGTFQSKEPKLYLGSSIAMEAWVKLSSAPEKKAWVIKREQKVSGTNGFGLFINPDLSFGGAIDSITGNSSTISSSPGVVPVNEWVHLAATSIDCRYMVLYLNGKEINRRQASSGEGINFRTKEKAGAPVTVGQGVPGVVDEVRVHPLVTKLWEKPAMPWISSLRTKKIIPLKDILTPGTKVNLYCSFNNTDKPQIEIAKLKVRGSGKYVDGVLGEAYRGGWDAYGNIVSSGQGTLEFWSRPVGISNYSDRNVRVVSNSLFSFYIFNTTGTFRPLALYFKAPDKKLRFARDGLNTDVYSGKWYHYLFRWDKNTVDYFIDGKKASGTSADFSVDMMKQLSFNVHHLFGDIDELYVYDKKLSDVEALNTYYRYTDPDKVRKNPKDKVASFKFWHMPGSRELYLKVKFLNPDFATAHPEVRIADASGKICFSAPVENRDSYQKYKLPVIPGGNYSIYLGSGKELTEKQEFRNQRFAWEGNKLGITDEIYPPFTPVKCDGLNVSVVLRKYKMNGFGLWDEVISESRELLAAPVKLVATAADGQELSWRTSVKKSATDTYASTAVCPGVKIDTTSKIDCDGMMKVTMKLQKPSANPVKLKSLYLDIPLKASVAELMHEDAVSHRRNFSGALPKKQGVIWDSVNAMRASGWRNAFTGYIWLGGAERGLAWFAANDKGWYTQKNMKATLMQVIRHGETVSLRVYLINKPVTITKNTELTFGLQASPTRPMPDDFRTKGILLQGVGLSVHVWGGLSCSWKYPWQEQWEIVDKIAASRNGGKADKEFFEKFQKKHHVPKVHGTRDWVKDCLYFSGRKSSTKRSDFVYFEEMYALTPGPEWHTYMDEWSASRLAEKSYPTMDVYKKEIMVNPNARINYNKSYIDFGLYYMNEWMKRGVSPYWDNCYLKLLTNPWTSDAYVCEDGNIQPASSIWQQREYMKRTWNLLNYWKQHQKTRPLDHVAHMTNTNLIPLFSWSTINYDIEMDQAVYANNFEQYKAGEPYAPEFLLAESTGRQVGAYPYLVHDVFKRQFKLPYDILGVKTGEIEAEIREWGMRTVHEINSGGPFCGEIPASILSKALYNFGYSSKDVKVWNYWSDLQAFKVTPDNVKGLLLTRAADKKMLLVLQSWNKETTEVKVEIDPRIVGFAPGKYVYDALHNRRLEMNGDTLKLKYDFPYETGVYVISQNKPDANVLFEDDFNAGLNPGWSYLSNYLKIKDGALLFDVNSASWRGATRLFKTFDLPVYDDAELSFDYQLGKVPSGDAEIMDVTFPAAGISGSRHGLSHSMVDQGITLYMKAYPGKGLRLMVVYRMGKTYKQLAWKYLNLVDVEPHKVRIACSGTNYRVYFDDKEVLAATIPAIKADGFSFAANARRKLSDEVGSLRLDNIRLTAGKVDYSGLETKRKRALANAAAILKSQSDKLKREAVKIFGTRHGPELYRLSLFRHPEQDARELCQRIKTENRTAARDVLLKLLRQLDKRKQEYVEAMKSIGQPLERLPEYRKAETIAKEYLNK